LSAATIPSSGVITETLGAPASARLHRRDQLLREMERARRADPDDARLARHPEPRERPDAHGDPVRELRL
jgi:hypothetical protein